jgi:hypothetical protein
MPQVLTPRVLERETETHKGSGGISAENGSCGFRPAFLDTATGIVYLSRYADGRPAPFHLLEGLPEELILARNLAGTVEKVRSSLVSGFVRAGRFYSREEAAWQVCNDTLCVQTA